MKLALAPRLMCRGLGGNTTFNIYGALTVTRSLMPSLATPSRNGGASVTNRFCLQDFGIGRPMGVGRSKDSREVRVHEKFDSFDRVT
jgi:hypothetical protein